jgi:quinoprotein glucose dehydrogenase
MSGRTGYRLAYAGLVAGLLWACSPAIEAPKNTDSVANGEWLTWGGDPGYQRYSPLDQINADNAKTLTVAWRWNALPFSDRPDANLKATPLYIDGVLYAPTGVNQAVALDPETGAEIWRFNPEPADIGGRAASVSSRALAYWTDGISKRLFHNTPDGRLISIDAATGKADPAFGNAGYVLLKEQLRPDGTPAPFVGSSSPAVVVGDVVVAQMVADITSANKEATPGHIRGYDVRTGKLLWTFHTIPQAGEVGNDTWQNDSWKYTGNAGVWSMISADPELGYIYLPVETPTHDFYGGHRPGDNLFAESIVCLNAKTGERVWHFQIVHHGVWDYDPPAAPILHDIVKDGKTIKAVTQLTKQGMSFVFDRATGQPIWPIEERAVPQHPPGIDMKNERLSPTQPFPTKPAPYVQLGYSEDSLIDFTPALRKEALAIASRYVKGPIYTPTTPVIKGGTQGTWVQPGYGGGSNWNGAAIDPDTGLMYVPNRNAAYVAALTPPDPKITNWDYIRAPTGAVPGPQGLPILKPPYSFVTATDMNRGEHVWTKPIGSAPASIRNHPALKGLNLDWDAMGQPGVRPAPLVTKTLMFMAESGNLSGDPGGPIFRAYDKATGEVRAEITLPERASGAPMTYLHKGRQYIVIAVATQEHPAEFVALALPDPNKPAAAIASSAPPPTDAVQPASAPSAPAPAPQAAATPPTPDELVTGRSVYARACVMCHGPAGAGIPGGPPRLAGLKDVPAMKRAIASGGANMPPMATMLTAAEIDAVAKFTAAGFPPE